MGSAVGRCRSWLTTKGAQRVPETVFVAWHRTEKTLSITTSLPNTTLRLKAPGSTEITRPRAQHARQADDATWSEVTTASKTSRPAPVHSMTTSAPPLASDTDPWC